MSEDTLETVTFYLPYWAASAHDAMRDICEMEEIEYSEFDQDDDSSRRLTVEAINNPHDNALLEFLRDAKVPFDYAHQGNRDHSPGEGRMRYSGDGQSSFMRLSTAEAFRNLMELSAAALENQNRGAAGFLRVAKELGDFVTPLTRATPLPDNALLVRRAIEAHTGEANSDARPDESEGPGF